MDDDPVLQSVCRSVLSAKGCEHEVVCDGLRAIAAFEAARDEGRPFATLVLDLTVTGGMGGIETLRRLKAIDSTVCAIASSGYSENAVMSAPFEHGFAAGLPKPYTARELDEVIQRALARVKPG